MSTLLTLAAADQVATASTSTRVVEGLLVPYGQVGRTPFGPVTFSAGSIAVPEQVGRVKLLDAHDQRVSVGHATSITESPAGLRATFSVAAGEAGDRVLAEVADGRRDGLSAGVRLDDTALRLLAAAASTGEVAAASGQLIEGSVVSIPAFDDARADGSAAHVLAAAAADQTVAVFAWSPQTAPPAPSNPEENAPVTTTALEPTPGAVAPVPVPPPAVVTAASGVVVTAEPPVYTFDGNGPSFVRDAWQARFGYDTDARDRFTRFSEEMRTGGPTRETLTAAVATRSTTTGLITSPTPRPDLLLAAIDKGRPLISRLNPITLTDATPFTIPTEPNFTAVGDHPEGQAHFAEGALSTITSVTVTPGAISGAYRLSRELIDASNPAIDSIALNAMLRDYRRASEAKAVAAIVAGGGSLALSINTVAKVRGALNAFQDRDDIPADFVLASTGFFGTLLTEADTTGRPMLPFTGPSNAVGTVPAGYTGASVDGTEVAKASTVPANTAMILRTDSVLIGESPVSTFRFEEVEGPGVIKLALWAYFAAAVIRANGVQRLTTAAA